MFAVYPKTNCPHLEACDLESVYDHLTTTSTTTSGGVGILSFPCISCQDTSENWMCLLCEGVFCSRYVNAHMAVHNAETGHAVALSFSDASVWCYDCDSYVTSERAQRVTRKIGEIKFPEEKSFCSAPVEQAETASLTYEDIVRGIRDKTYSKIAVMTGAGISVAAGIPDFRTPGTGLYAKVDQLGLPYPEAIFSLDFLREDPLPFFKIANGFLTFKAKPVQAHKFIKKVADEGQLLINFTQNIDGLELDAGLPENLLIQAHGHMRSAHCIECGIEAPISEFFSHVSREEVFYCPRCGGTTDSEERGVIKPDVIFFGEQLPMSFRSKMTDIEHSDLVFVMGTSLKVYPFASLLSIVAPGVPIVLLNREDPGCIDTDQHPFVFLQGDIEDSVKKLAEDLGWVLGEMEEVGGGSEAVPEISSQKEM